MTEITDEWARAFLADIGWRHITAAKSGSPEPEHEVATLIKARVSALMAERDAEIARLREQVDVLKAEPSGWIVGNSNGTAWRYWAHGMPNWTPHCDEATRFVRRCDAEEVHAEDEDAWTIVSLANARQTLGDTHEQD